MLAAEATPEQQANFERMQAVTGVKWGAYLAAWGGWLAWDVYSSNKAKEDAQQSSADQDSSAAAPPAGADGGSAADEGRPQ